MLTGLDQRVDHLRTTTRGAAALTETLLSAHPHLSVELEHLRETIRALEDGLAGFRLPSDQEET